MSQSIESDAFNRTLAGLKPGQATRCSDWRVQELACHIGAGAAEIRRNVEAYNQGGAAAVPATRELEEREAPFRALGFEELRHQIGANTDAMMEAVGIALAQDPEAVTPWVGRQMPIAAFLTHARSEYAVHRWDLVGDDDVSLELLAQPELTAHAVMALGEVLVLRGVGTARSDELGPLSGPSEPGRERRRPGSAGHGSPSPGGLLGSVSDGLGNTPTCPFGGSARTTIGGCSTMG